MKKYTEKPETSSARKEDHKTENKNKNKCTKKKFNKKHIQIETRISAAKTRFEKDAVAKKRQEHQINGKQRNSQLLEMH